MIKQRKPTKLIPVFIQNTAMNCSSCTSDLALFYVEKSAPRSRSHYFNTVNAKRNIKPPGSGSILKLNLFRPQVAEQNLHSTPWKPSNSDHALTLMFTASWHCYIHWRFYLQHLYSSHLKHISRRNA